MCGIEKKICIIYGLLQGQSKASRRVMMYGGGMSFCHSVIMPFCHKHNEIVMKLGGLLEHALG